MATVHEAKRAELVEMLKRGIAAQDEALVNLSEVSNMRVLLSESAEVRGWRIRSIRPALRTIRLQQAEMRALLAGLEAEAGGAS